MPDEPKDASVEVIDTEARGTGADSDRDPAFDAALEKMENEDGTPVDETPAPDGEQTPEAEGEPASGTAASKKVGSDGKPVVEKPATEAKPAEKTPEQIAAEKEATTRYWDTVTAAHPDAVKLAQTGEIADWAEQQGGEAAKLLADKENPAAAIKLLAQYKAANPDAGKPPVYLSDVEWAKKYIPGFDAKFKAGKDDDGKDAESSIAEVVETYPDIGNAFITMTRNTADAIMRSVPAMVEQRVNAILAQRDAEADERAELEKANQGASEIIASDEFKAYRAANPFIDRVFDQSSPQDKADIVAGYKAFAASRAANDTVTDQRKKIADKRKILSGLPKGSGSGVPAAKPGAALKSDMNDEEWQRQHDAALEELIAKDE